MRQTLFLWGALLLAPAGASGQLYRNAPVRGPGRMQGPPRTFVASPGPTEDAAPPVAPPVQAARAAAEPRGVAEGSRLSLSLAISSPLGEGIRAGYHFSLANRLLGGSNALTLGFELGLFPSYEHTSCSSYGCYDSDDVSAYLNMILGMRFGLGDHFDFGPRIGLGLWRGHGDITPLVSIGTSTSFRPSTSSNFRLFLDIDTAPSSADVTRNIVRDSQPIVIVSLGIGSGF